MSIDPRRIQRLMTLTERLTEALEADIAALERGRPREMRTQNVEVQQMSAFYAREAAGIGPSVLQQLPKDAREQLTQATVRFREVLTKHGRVLTRVRTMTEGMIRAIADDVAKKKSALRPYAPTPAAPLRSPGAMIYNRVI